MELNPIRSVAARDCEADGKVKGAQLHVLCGWDDPDTYKDAKVSCISKSKEFHWICLHALAVCVFIVRGLRILTYRSDVKGAFIRFAFAACYLLVGVVLPSWSHSLQDSSPVECIRKYCENTSELVHNSKRRWNTELLDSSVCSTFFSVACVVAQISRLLSLVCPLRMVLLFVSDYKHQALFFGMSEDTYQRVAFSMSLIGVIGMMAFIGGPFSARGCCTDVVQRSTFIVEGLISEIENEGKSIEYLWQRHFLINKALLKVWHCRSVGGIWATRIFVHLMVSLCLGAYTMRGIIQSTPLMIVCAIVSAAMGFSLVFRMANVTYLCESRRIGCRSVAAAVDKRTRSIMWLSGSPLQAASREDLRQFAFQDYVVSSGMGIDLYLARVDYNLAIQLLRYLFVYAPIVLSLLSFQLHGDGYQQREH